MVLLLIEGKYKVIIDQLSDKPDDSLKEILFTELKDDSNGHEIVKEYHDEFATVFNDEELQLLECPLCRRTIFLKRDRSQFPGDFLEKIIMPEGTIVKTKTICEDANNYKVYSEGNYYTIEIKKHDDTKHNKKDDLKVD
jgi:hypothetical protein